ncbi:dienelactone hydrolase family protein [Roseateles koreensis]|uniref:Dienelactone hydrolase family protein n=1 Tax=Roseateles koreensis TaxID=2987526 RepID=A0ABT5KTK3_9BURK|nr:dienelactone hydrolase family protein [Roseateles koreensis]MDC8786268.1 dienelactone hydrolase family protein [Roseateles koreensis]
MEKNSAEQLVGTRATHAGFAAAVQPVCEPQIVHTPTEGLQADWVHISVDGFEVPAYVAYPQGAIPPAAGAKAPPVLLVIHEIFGVHEHIADVVRRFAQQGYLAIAPALLLRQGDAASFSSIEALMSQVIRKVPDAQVMRDLDAVVDWAHAQGGDTGRLAVTGFCWGGRVTWLYAAHQPAIRAGVAWYGRLVGPVSELAPQHPVDVVGRLAGPVLGLYAGQDSGIPLDTVDKMKSTLRRGSESARRSEIEVYAEASHAFYADYRPSYHPEAAADAWRRCLAWFERHV